jgi:4-diphosphocytidyl-2-C-methyl-D-erythritol kinase
LRRTGWRTVQTAAKINLHLQVGPRDKSGYHAVDTVLQTVDWGDRLRVGPASPGRLTLEVTGTEAAPVGEENLVYRAARGVLEAAHRRGRDPRQGVRIQLHKRVPAGAGLGGGSGDAGATLLLLNRHLGLGLSRRVLLSVARRLGADVPFFLCGGLARGRGRGDHVRPLAPLPRLPVLVVVPRLRLSTAEVYKRFDEISLTSTHHGFRMRPPVGSLRGRRPVSGFVNDLERPVFERHPVLAETKADLRDAGALVAGLSGSGSALFGVFGSLPRLDGLLKRWRRRGWEIHYCHTVDQEGYGARFR